jgi:hypothetical protein
MKGLWQRLEVYHSLTLSLSAFAKATADQEIKTRPP